MHSVKFIRIRCRCRIPRYVYPPSTACTNSREGRSIGVVVRGVQYLIPYCIPSDTTIPIIVSFSDIKVIAAITYRQLEAITRPQICEYPKSSCGLCSPRGIEEATPCCRVSSSGEGKILKGVEIVLNIISQSNLPQTIRYPIPTNGCGFRGKRGKSVGMISSSSQRDILASVNRHTTRYRACEGYGTSICPFGGRSCITTKLTLGNCCQCSTCPIAKVIFSNSTIISSSSPIVYIYLSSKIRRNESELITIE